MKTNSKVNFVMLGLGLILATFTFLYLRGCVNKLRPDSQPNPQIVLKPTDKEAVLFNSNTHTLTIVTPTETRRQYADDPIVHVSKNNDVTVEAHSVGRRFTPFVGLSYGDGPRLNVGLSLYHFWRLDTNMHLAFSLDDAKAHHTVIPIVSLSYNVYRNTSLFLGVDPINAVTNGSYLHGGFVVSF